ncbi:Nnf1-domain-containing protein [Exophiala viscosa]|uniref:Nnf1-domain-containing protein n=1 Tax=Exophiala viscosa TaxID=2486360 RepID=UPI00218FB388|nr:Nnf1-domain-containing protein [Exophiala viscosa]
MSAQIPASPSPAPEAPVASAPGPRAAALQKVFAGALSSSIRANSYANFSSCFPTPAKYCPSALEGVWKQLNTRLEEECMRDFEKILEERQVIEGLNQWDNMIEEARRRKNRAVEGEEPPRPLHTLSADELHSAHLTPYLQQAQDELSSKVHSTQAENATIFSKITEQRAEIEQLLSGLDRVIKDIEGSVDAIYTDEQSGFGELKGDVWTTEQELAATR